MPAELAGDIPRFKQDVHAKQDTRIKKRGAYVIPTRGPDSYRLYCLADRIRQEAHNSIHSIVLIGRHLLEAQAILKEEGTWVKWIKDEFEWSHQTAYNFMNVAKLVEKYPEVVRGEIPTSAIYLLAGAPEEAIDDVIEKSMDGSIPKGKVLQVVRNAKWKEAIAELVKTEPGIAYHEIERRMQDPYYHETAVAMFKEYEPLFEEFAGEDGVVLETDVGMTIEERYPPPDPSGLPPNCNLEENADGCKIVMWVDGKPHTLASFPRRLPPVAMAWRNAALLVVLGRLSIKVWEETVL